MEHRWTIPKLESNTGNPYSETKTLKPVCIQANHMSEKNKSLLSATECGGDLSCSISWLRRPKLSTLNCVLIFIICPLLWGDFCGFHGGSDGKESACKAGDPGLIPGSGRSSGEGNGYAFQYSCLENPVARSLAGYSVWGHKELDTTGRLTLSLLANSQRDWGPPKYWATDVPENSLHSQWNLRLWDCSWMNLPCPSLPLRMQMFI